MMETPSHHIHYSSDEGLPDYQSRENISRGKLQNPYCRQVALSTKSARVTFD